MKKQVLNTTNSKLFNVNNKYLIILKLACFFVFAGRAYQHIFWDAPYRSILWDESLMSNFMSSVFGLEWGEFVESEQMDNRIQGGIKTIGYLLSLSALSVFTIDLRPRISKFFIGLGIVLLFILAFVSFKSRFFQFGEWAEFGIQIFSPAILLMLYADYKKKTVLIISKIAIALTFIGHGLYAFGFYPQPGNYIDMVITITGLNEDTTRVFLSFMGIVDFVVAIYIFLPTKTSQYALLYCVIWGLLTALARVVAGFSADFMLQTLHQWGFESTFRLAHGLLPLWVFMVQRNSDN